MRQFDTCRQEYPDLLLGNMSIKNISEFDNQETIVEDQNDPYEIGC